MGLLVEIEGAQQTAGLAALHNIDVMPLNRIFRSDPPVCQCSLDFSGESQQRVEFRSSQIVSGQFIGSEVSSRRSDPARLSIVGPGANSPVGVFRKVDPNAALIGRLR